MSRSGEEGGGEEERGAGERSWMSGMSGGDRGKGGEVGESRLHVDSPLRSAACWCREGSVALPATLDPKIIPPAVKTQNSPTRR